jgi:hypothetical protein
MQVDLTEDGTANKHKNGARQKVVYILKLLLMMVMKMKGRMFLSVVPDSKWL